MAALKVLTVAVAKGRAGYVYMAGGELRDWNISVKAVKSGNQLVEWLQTLINQLQPDVVVTEKITADCRKGGKTKRLIRTLSQLAAHNYVLDVSVERPRDHPCKYTEAAALAERYPELAGWLPKKRRYFDSEPRNTILFEALALAEAVILGPPERLAAAMG
ncbi:hypothetical protein [uncultured Roseobacter sp.]|uniref:hypothetical protein n=1 Tax=uncultured Roseobacter sp. TaxID=114847 RepID=UPI0026237D8A|nr:hypothetical protein [uncultured Roseobacter sp.]